MKAFIPFLSLCLTITNVVAQVEKKASVSSPVNAKTAVPAITGAEMVLISNVTSAHSIDDFSLGGFSLTNKQDAVSGASAILQAAMQETIDKTIFGDGTPKNYGITYWSDPVLKLYNKHISQKLADLIQANDDQYSSSNQGINEFIASKVADQLVLAATNAGAYVNTWAEALKGGDLGPKTLDLLKTKTKEKFKTETWTADYQQPYYFRDALLSIHYQMPFDYVTDKSNGYSFVSSPANTRGFFFMGGFAANSNCAIAVIIAKSQIETNKINSKLTQLLQSAKWGSLYRPLLEYKNQSAFFEVHQVGMDWLQAFTSTNQGTLLFDKENNCPSETAYAIAQKIRSASAFNSAK
ncbi:hypothetical protein [Runella sp.]|uniref:hypothetical protein n=1 Tax=Runella sp. TaxID=1960881 RepID=UPI003D153278